MVKNNVSDGGNKGLYAWRPLEQKENIDRH